MRGRTLSGRVSALVVFAVAWQAMAVAPLRAVAADPPALPPVMDCGFGFVCNAALTQHLVPGSGPIVVTGPEDRIVQGHGPNPNDPTDVSAADAWAPLETEAKAVQAALHGVDIDSRLTDFGRGELRAYIFARLMTIAQMKPGDRTPMEQKALDKLTQLVKFHRVLAAQQALSEYNRWLNDKCDYTYPIGSDPNHYKDQLVVKTRCSLETDPFYGNPPPPSVAEFGGIGAGLAYPDLLNKPGAAKVQRDMAKAMIELGGMGAAGLAGVYAAIIAANAPAVATAVATAIGSWVSTATATGPVWLATAEGLTPVAEGALIYPEAATAVAPIAVAGAVAIAIFAVVTIAIQSWILAEELAIPGKLQQQLDDAQANTPDVTAMSNDDQGRAELNATFLSETMPDYEEQRPTTSALQHAAGDPDFTRTVASAFGEQPTSTVTTIGPIDWDGTLHTAYLTNGWWAIQSGSDPIYRYSLGLTYVNWSGEQWTASVSGDTFLHTRLGHPDDSFSSPSITFLTQTGMRMRATLHANRPPTLFPSTDGPYNEGDIQTFHANASDPDGDPVTVDWVFEPNANGPALLIKDGQGRSQLDYCYTEPLGKVSADMLGFCPWDKASGPNPTHRARDNGNLHVRVVATDSHGATASMTFLLRINSVKPMVTLTPLASSTIDEGAQLTLTGAFTDPGDDKATVVVDWGDGSSSQQWFPCDYGPLFANGCTLVRIPIPPADDPSPFTFTHTFTTEPPGDTLRTITVTTTDDDGSKTVKTVPVTVHNDRPVVTITTPSDGHTYRLGKVVNASFACAALGGIASCTGTVPYGAPIDTSTIGAHAFSVDAVGNDAQTTSRTSTYRVIYPFKYLGTTKAPPSVMKRGAGSFVAVEFSLKGNHGLGILDGNAKTQLSDCQTWAALGPLTNARTVELGHGPLSTATYRLTWKSKLAWAGTCQTFTFSLDDGTTRTLRYRFT